MEIVENLELFEGSLPVEKITNAWYDKYRNSNYGAIITFVGVVRDENKIDGLSFDIYEPILNTWFNSWIEKAKKEKKFTLDYQLIFCIKAILTS